MKQYLKMADVFNVEVMVDNSTAYTLKSELDKLYRVREVNNHTLMCSGNDVADYAAHAINSHDELVAMNGELLEALELVINDKAPGYHDCIDDGESESAWCVARKAINKARGE